MKTYIGKISSKYVVTVVAKHRTPRRLSPVTDVPEFHYTCGFHWEHGIWPTPGMNPLAFAILMDHFTDGRFCVKQAAALATALHADFAILAVSQFNETWRMTEDEVEQTLASILTSIATNYDRQAAGMEIMAAEITDHSLTKHMRVRCFR